MLPKLDVDLPKNQINNLRDFKKKKNTNETSSFAVLKLNTKNGSKRCETKRPLKKENNSQFVYEKLTCGNELLLNL